MTEEEFPILQAFIEGCKTQNFDACAELIKSFGVFKRLHDAVKSSKVYSGTVGDSLAQVKLLCCKKFPLLVLVDLGGTLFFRSSDKAVRGAKFDFKLMKYMYFMRPGYNDFLRKVHDQHPRVKLGFYSSIMYKNIQPVMLEVLTGELAELRNEFVVFD